jgi:hypothetical protein
MRGHSSASAIATHFNGFGVAVRFIVACHNIIPSNDQNVWMSLGEAA